MKTVYANELNEIWERFIPKKGAATSLQGEMLRELEKMQFEIQDNGMINWDEDYDYFCDFLTKNLKEVSGLTDEQRVTALRAVSKITEQGKMAMESNAEEKDMQWLYNDMMNDEFYAPIYDAIALFYKSNREEIAYKHERTVNR